MIFAVLTGLFSLTLSASVNALNYGDFSKKGGHALMIKNIVNLIKAHDNDLYSDSDSDVDTDSYNADKMLFLEAVSSAREKLSELESGLPNPYDVPDSVDYCVHVYDEFSDAQFEQLKNEWVAKIDDFTTDTDSEDIYVSQSRVADVETYTEDSQCLISEYQEIGVFCEKKCVHVIFDPPACDYDHTDNLNEFEHFTIKDLKGYKKFDRNVNSAACFMEYDEKETDPYDALQWVLARHAGKVDDELKDSVFWFKPSNTMAGKLITEITDKAINAAKDVSIFMASPTLLLIAGIRCFFKLFTDDRCSSDDLKFIPDIPVEESVAALPGVVSHSIPKYVGLWHMMQVDLENEGEYNNIPGTTMEYAGPGGNPGILDIGAMTIADLVGLTVHKKDSKGVSRYGQYDEKSRSRAEWQIENVGHLEFSPVYNLAEFGWKKFVEGSRNSKYLGWPLHALGDEIVPMHLVGTMSWGHAPFEDVMTERWKYIFPAVKDDVFEKGFEYWKKYCNNGQMESVKDLMIEVAKTNRSMVGDWAWNDHGSFIYLGRNEGRFHEDDKEEAKSFYTDNPDFNSQMAPIVANASGAALALLVCASQMVEPAVDTVDSKCPEGYKYCPSHYCGFQCIEGFEGYSTIKDYVTQRITELEDTDSGVDTDIIID